MEGGIQFLTKRFLDMDLYSYSLLKNEWTRFEVKSLNMDCFLANMPLNIGEGFES